MVEYVKLTITKADNTTVDLTNPEYVRVLQEIGSVGSLVWREWDPDGNYANAFSNGDQFELYFWRDNETPVKVMKGKIIKYGYPEEIDPYSETLEILGHDLTAYLTGPTVNKIYTDQEALSIIDDLIDSLVPSLKTDYLFNTGKTVSGSYEKSYEDLFNVIWEVLDYLNFNLRVETDGQVLAFPSDKMPILIDSFNVATASNGSSWTVESGVWTRSGGVYYSSGTGTEVSYIGSPGWNDYEVRFREKISSGTSLGVEVRYTDANNLYRIRRSGTELILERIKAGVTTQLDSFSKTFSTGTWYYWRIIISGSSIKIYIDDDLLISITDPDPLSTGGYLRLRTVDTVGYFDDIQIYKLAFDSYTENNLIDHSFTKADASQLINRVVVIGGTDASGNQVIALAEDPALIEKYGVKMLTPIYDSTILDTAQAKRRAEIELTRRKLELESGVITMDGTSSYRLGDFISLSITGYNVSGDYVIIGIEHLMDEEWLTKITVSKLLPELMEMLVEMRRADRSQAVRDLSIGAIIFRVYEALPDTLDIVTATTQTTGTFQVGTAKVGFADCG